MIRVGLFGGSFNPPHEGHVLAVVHVLSTRQVDRVLVVPVYEHALGKELSPFEHRLAMSRLAFDWLPNVEVSDVEADLGRPSRTLRTVQALGAAHPDWSLRLMVGSDILREISKWHAFEEIERRAPPLVIERREPEGGGEALEGLLPEVSSTRVRELLRRAQADAAARARLARLLPADVLEHALGHRLYER